MRKLKTMLTPLIGMRKRIVIAWLFAALLGAPLTGCTEETVGQQFRDILAHIDAQCKKDKLGPYLDKNDPEYRNKRARTDCDILKIKPVDPLATEEGRFAYSIKLPPPHDKLKAEYRKGMSAASYFKELCEKDAGDFVFKTAEGVDGIMLMRPFPQKTLPFLSEMTASTQLALWETTASSLAEKVYSYVDAVEFDNSIYPGKTQLVHYSPDATAPKRPPNFGVMRSPIKESKTRYGLIFRAVNLPHDANENGIKGGELIVRDNITKEILAFRRTFTLMHFVNRQSAEMVSGTICMNVPYQKSGYQFISEILKPAKKTKAIKGVSIALFSEQPCHVAHASS